MKFGTLQSVLGEPLERVFAVAARLGFEGVELDWNEPDHAFDVGEVRRAAQDAGVEVCSVAAHFLNGGNIANPDHAERARASIRRGIELCSQLGAGALLVPFFGPAEITDETEGLLIENLRQLAPEAQAANVRLGLETTRWGEQMKRVFDAVASRFVGAYWDMGNSLCFGLDVLTDFSDFAPYFVQIHAKEFSGEEWRDRPGYYPGLNQVPLGEGEVPLDVVMPFLFSMNYDGWIVLETGQFGDPHGSAKRALETLKSHKKYA